MYLGSGKRVESVFIQQPTAVSEWIKRSITGTPTFKIEN